MTPSATHRHRTGAVSSLVLAVAVGVGLVVTALANGAGSLTARIVLDRERVGAGGAIIGKLILDNATSKASVLLRGCVTDGRFAVGLEAADGDLQGAAFWLVGCSPLQALVVAKPGTTVYRFETRATYSACLQIANDRQPPTGSPNWEPLCLKDSRGERDIAPPLPPGEYTAVFLPDGKWQGPKVTPAPLTITAAD